MSRKAGDFVFALTDERGMDPEQFDNGTYIYSVDNSLKEARRAQDDFGCGVIVKCRWVKRGVLKWVEYIP